jgi:hypothetical protein
MRFSDEHPALHDDKVVYGGVVGTFLHRYSRLGFEMQERRRRREHTATARVNLRSSMHIPEMRRLHNWQYTLI